MSEEMRVNDLLRAFRAFIAFFLLSFGFALSEGLALGANNKSQVNRVAFPAPVWSYSVKNHTVSVLSPDEKKLLVASGQYLKDKRGVESLWQGKMALYDSLTGRKIRQVLLRSVTNNLAIFPDGKRFVSLEHQVLAKKPNVQIHIWDLLSFKITKTYYVAAFDCLQVAVSPDETCLALDSGTGKIRLLHLADGNIESLAGQLSMGITQGIAFSPNGKYIAAASYSAEAMRGDLAVWNTKTKKLIVHFEDTEQSDELGSPPFFMGDNKMVVCGNQTVDVAAKHLHLKSLLNQLKGECWMLFPSRKNQVLGVRVGVLEVWDIESKRRVAILGKCPNNDENLLFIAPRIKILALENVNAATSTIRLYKF